MIISYLAIGTLLMFIMEVWMNPTLESPTNKDDEFKFDLITRAFNIILWPLTLAIILKHAIQYIKNILK
jgi:hypothetical protein